MQSTRSSDSSNTEHSSYYDDALNRLNIDFGKQRPLYVNLLDDLGSIDFFVIDGDSLLLECLSSPTLDLGHGGQPLHLFYLIEDFLQRLKACHNSQFCFAFFQEHESFWQGQNQSSPWVARHTLLQHLQSTLQQSVHVFPSWQSTTWQTFVREVQTNSQTRYDLQCDDMSVLCAYHMH